MCEKSDPTWDAIALQEAIGRSTCPDANHGAGIFTYKTAWFLSGFYVGANSPWSIWDVMEPLGTWKVIFSYCKRQYCWGCHDVPCEKFTECMMCDFICILYIYKKIHTTLWVTTMVIIKSLSEIMLQVHLETTHKSEPAEHFVWLQCWSSKKLSQEICNLKGEGWFGDSWHLGSHFSLSYLVAHPN